MEIAIVNNSSMVSSADAATMTQACQIQNTQHMAPTWNQLPATINFYADQSQVPASAWLISIIDSESDVPDALGYHTVSNDHITGYIMCQPVLQNGGVVLCDPNNPQNVSVASVLSHEVCEAFADRYCNFWADGTPISQGSSYALEVCDSVEDVSYVVVVNGQNVSVSDFVLPTFFDQTYTAADGQLDYCNKLSTCFTMTSGGYMVVRNAPGTEQQIFGREMPQWKQIMKSKSDRFGKRKHKMDSFWIKLWKWFINS